MPYVNYNLTDLNNLAKYATGAAINHTDISFSDGVVGYGILAGGAKTIQGGKWLWKNRKDYKGAINTAKANFRKQAALERSLKGKNIFETTKNFAQYQKTTLEAGKAASGTSKLAKAGKFVKGNGGFFLISLACESPNIYKTYKELGADRGHKQLLKSAAIVGAETVGYAAGAKAGAAIGASIGTAICPGIGSAVGAVVGVLVGLAGSWLAGKGMRALVGKSELEIEKENQARRIVLQASTHPEFKEKLMAKTAEKLLSEEAQFNPDTQIALQSLRNIGADNTDETENLEEEKAALPRSEKPSEKQKKSSIDKKLDDFARRINSNGFSASYPMMLGLTT